MTEVRRAVLRDLGLVFIAAFGIRVIWALVIPPWVTPDEPSHFTYVSHLVEQGEIPYKLVRDSKYPELSSEMTQSWNLMQLGAISGLGSAIGGTLQYFPVHYDYLAVRTLNAPHEQRRTASAASATPYPPLYYSIVAGFYRLFFESPLLSRLYAVRIGSGLLGALSCCFAYLLGFELYRDRNWGRAVGLSMAMMPMHAFITGSVNNDAAMVLGATALCWLLLRAVLSPTLTLGMSCWIGLTCGLIMISKPTGAPVVVAAALAVLLLAFPVSFRPWRVSWARAGIIAAFVGCLLAANGPWMLYRLFAATYPSVTSTTEGGVVARALETSPYSFWAYLQHQNGQGLKYFEWLLVRTYWGNFGWLELMLSDRVYTAIMLVSAIGALGFLVRMVRRPNERKGLALLAGLIFFQVFILFFVVDYLLAFAKTGSGLGLQGRYFFATLAPWLLLLLTGISYLCRDHPMALRLAPLGVLAVQLISLATMLANYYSVVLG